MKSLAVLICREVSNHLIPIEGDKICSYRAVTLSIDSNLLFHNANIPNEFEVQPPYHSVTIRSKIEPNRIYLFVNRGFLFEHSMV